MPRQNWGPRVRTVQTLAQRDTACLLLVRFLFVCVSSPLIAVADAFLEQAVSYQQFVDNPAIIDDPNLVVKIGNK